MTTYQDVTSMVRRPAPVCRWIGALAFLKGWQNEIYGSSEEFVGKLTARSSTAELRQQRFTRRKTRKTTTTTAALSSFRFCHLNDRPNQPCPKMSGLNMLRHGRNLLKRRVLTSNCRAAPAKTDCRWPTDSADEAQFTERTTPSSHIHRRFDCMTLEEGRNSK